MEERTVRRYRQVSESDPLDPSLAAPAATVDETVVDARVTRVATPAEMGRRIVVFIFGLVQLLIVLRIGLLLIDADRANGIVAFIYSTSNALVDPFEGIVRTDAVSRGAAVLDVTALVALVGWTIVELLVLAVLNIGRREP